MTKYIREDWKDHYVQKKKKRLKEREGVPRYIFHASNSGSLMTFFRVANRSSTKLATFEAYLFLVALSLPHFLFDRKLKRERRD